MKYLIDITILVRNILEDKEETRNNDNVLYVETLSLLSKLMYDFDVTEMPTKTVLSNLRFLNLPSYETVSRVRRKLQNKNPHLRANEKVEVCRKEKEKVFMQYAKLW